MIKKEIVNGTVQFVNADYALCRMELNDGEEVAFEYLDTKDLTCSSVIDGFSDDYAYDFTAGGSDYVQDIEKRYQIENRRLIKEDLATETAELRPPVDYLLPVPGKIENLYLGDDADKNRGLYLLRRDGFEKLNQIFGRVRFAISDHYLVAVWKRSSDIYLSLLDEEGLPTNPLERIDLDNCLAITEEQYELGAFVFEVYQDYLFIELQNHHALICIDLNTRQEVWRIDNCVKNRWCLGNNGKIYGVYKGILKIVDAASGNILLDKPIQADWVQENKEALNLFQVIVSKTHLWCAFMGKEGLCAVNLETAEVDWHGLEGAVNAKPILANNRIYVQMMRGGIGLDNKGIISYILEGEGGYLEDCDNEFRLPENI